MPFKKQNKKRTGTPKNCVGSAVSRSCVTLAEFKQASFNEKNIKSLTCVGAASSPWQQAYFPEPRPLAASTPLLPPPRTWRRSSCTIFPAYVSVFVESLILCVEACARKCSLIVLTCLFVPPLLSYLCSWPLLDWDGNTTQGFL